MRGAQGCLGDYGSVATSYFCLREARGRDHVVGFVVAKGLHHRKRVWPGDQNGHVEFAIIRIEGVLVTYRESVRVDRIRKHDPDVFLHRVPVALLQPAYQAIQGCVSVHDRSAALGVGAVLPHPRIRQGCDPRRFLTSPTVAECSILTTDTHEGLLPVTDEVCVLSARRIDPRCVFTVSPKRTT